MNGTDLINHLIPHLRVKGNSTPYGAGQVRPCFTAYDGLTIQPITIIKLADRKPFMKYALKIAVWYNFSEYEE